jgi:hypothetical protein
MALPNTIISQADKTGHHPPYKSSGGNFYAVVYNTTNNDFEMHKASDPAGTWSQVDASNAPSSGLTTWSGGSFVLHQANFDMSDDTWAGGGTAKLTRSTPTAPIHYWVTAVFRPSDGIFTSIFNAASDRVMGGDKERIDYYNVSAGAVAIDGGGDIHYGNAVAVLGNNNGTHVIWNNQTLTADPPTTWDTTSEARTIDSLENLSTTVTGSLVGNSNDLALVPFHNAVFYVDGSNDRIFAGGVRQEPTLTAPKILMGLEDGSDDIQATTDEAFTPSNEPLVNSEVGVACLALDGTDLYYIYSGGGSDGVDKDIYYTKSTDNGTSWDTPTEHRDAVTCNSVSANIYTRGGDTVIGYIFDDGGTVKYDEIVISAGLPFQPFFSRKDNVLLKM